MGGLVVLLSLTSLLRVGHRVATLLDSTRESILALRYNFWVRRAGRGKPVLICNWLFRLFSRHISRTQSFQQNRHILFHALVALKLLVSLISRLVACSARIVVDKQTNGQTHRPKILQCACALSAGKWPTAHRHTMQEVPDLCNGAVLEKTPHKFPPSLPAEYVTSISGRTDAP